MANRRLDALRRTYLAKTRAVAQDLARNELAVHERADTTRLQKRTQMASLRRQATERFHTLARAYEREQNHIIEARRREIYRLPPSSSRELTWLMATARVEEMVAELDDPDDHQAAHREARRMFADAATHDAEYMMRALLSAAERRGWRDIVEAYATEVPDAAPILAEVDEIAAELSDTEITMSDASMFRLPPVTPPPPAPSLAVALDAHASQWPGGNGPAMAAQGDDGG